MFKKIQHIYFVGIGGSGMSGIAQVLLNLGYKVSGSDIKETESIRHLQKLGARINLCHMEENIKDIDVMVVSSAICKKNSEVAAAHRINIPVIPRAEMLAELMRLKYGIAVAGAHGKTTTTSMIALILAKAGMDPTIVIGGKLDSLGSNARLGKGDFLVAEADESDGSFLKLSPTIAVVTSLDEDHLDYYSGIAHIQETFLEFMNKIPFYGTTVFCMDQEKLQPLIPRLERKSITYGILAQADFMAGNIRFHENMVFYDLFLRGEKICPVQLCVPGTHNLYNSLAAFAVGMNIEIDPEIIREALFEFKGVHRRFEIIGNIDEIMVVDDYAHHPTEIKAVLKAAKRGWNCRTVVVFQPHRYSRTKDLFQHFATSFYEADVLFIVEIFSAGETSIAGVNSEAMVEEIQKYGHKNVRYISDNETLVKEIINVLEPGDMLLTLGAGNVGEISMDVFRNLKGSRDKFKAVHA